MNLNSKSWYAQPREPAKPAMPKASMHVSGKLTTCFVIYEHDSRALEVAGLKLRLFGLSIVEGSDLVMERDDCDCRWTSDDAD